MTMLLAARQDDVAASQLFLWRKRHQEGHLTAVAVVDRLYPCRRSLLR
ncbi:hypothetical protein [Citrobacter meridianamericanus]